MTRSHDILRIASDVIESGVPGLELNNLSEAATGRIHA